jgi:hypothetical protein
MENAESDSAIVAFQFNNPQIINYREIAMSRCAYSSTLDSSTWEPGRANCSDAAEGSIKESSRS